MNPEMGSPILPLLALALLAWLALSVVVAITWHMTAQATRRASYRASNQQGEER